MNNTLKRMHTVHYSEVDSIYRLRYDAIISSFQKVTFFHSTELGVDGPTLAKTSGAFWVLSRTKFKVLRLPTLGDEIEFETWPLPAGAIRFTREYKIKIGGEDAVLGSSDWCTLDMQSGTLRRAGTIVYPREMEHRTEGSGVGEYSKYRERMEEADYAYTYTPLFTDIDSNGHTNHVSYLKMALNTFSPEEFNSHDIEGVEISYVSQSHFGDEIRIYRRKTEYGYYIEGKLDNKTVFFTVFLEKGRA